MVKKVKRVKHKLQLVLPVVIAGDQLRVVDSYAEIIYNMFGIRVQFYYVGLTMDTLLHTGILFDARLPPPTEEDIQEMIPKRVRVK